MFQRRNSTIKGKLLHMLSHFRSSLFSYLRKPGIRKLETDPGLLAVLESMEEIFFSYDTREKKVLHLSAACEKVFGYRRKAFIQNPFLWFTQVVGDDRKKFEEAYGLLKRGEVFRCEYRIVRKDGYMRWLESKVRPILDKHGKIIRIDGISADITRRKETEENLRSAEVHLLASQRIARVGSWELYLTDPANFYTGTLKWSDETFRIFGYRPGEVKSTGHRAYEHVHPGDRERVEDTFKRALGEGKLYQAEYRIIRRDGTEAVVHEIGEFVFGPDNRTPLKIVGTVQDVTEQKQAEAALRRAEANLSHIFANTESAYLLLDTSAHILAFNPAARVLCGRLGKNLQLGMSYYDLLQEEKQGIRENYIRQLVEGKSKISYEVKLQSAAGVSLWVSVNMHPIINESGVVSGVTVETRDITQKKTYEEQIKQSNERYELVLKATNDLIWDWQLEENVIYRSENYDKVLGGRTNETTSSGMNWVDNIHEDDKERIVSGIFQKLTDPIALIWEEEYRYKQDGGEPVYVKDRGFIIRNSRKEAVRMVGAMRDITPEKLLQIERDRITSDLVHRNKDLEQFAYIVSHNLRAPVANILGLGTLLQKKDLDRETFNNCINALTVSTNLLNSIIIDLNHILQVRNEVNEKREVIDLAILLRDIRISIANLVDKENAVIKADFAQASKIFSLKSYLHSIFYNLIINSIKYKKENESPRLEIWTEQYPGKIKIHFKDNGTGIDLEANASKVFGLYKRFHFHIEGKGLGLFMVKTQVEALGGRIEVESMPRQGTEFTVELPASVSF